MKKNLPIFIANRYLISKKSHNVINIISIISSTAIGLGCMALIVVFSVFNGFGKILEGMYDSYLPDFIIESKKGKIVNLNSTTLIEVEKFCKDQGFFSPIIEENVYAQYSNLQCITTLVGVPDNYEQIERITSLIIDGDFKLHYGVDNLLNRAIVSEGLASQLHIKAQLSEPLSLYFPSRTEDISITMPMESILNDEILVSGVADFKSQENNNKVIAPLKFVRELMEYDDEQASRVEIYLNEFSTKNKYNSIEAKLKEILNNTANGTQSYILKNKHQQNQTLYRMMKSEKLAVSLILFFIILIVAVNILASLSLLIIDKKEDIQTFKSMGAPLSLIKRSFILHGWFICMAGAIFGIVIGLIICILQQTFGFISLPGNFVVDSYPVYIKFTDIILILFGVGVIGFIMSFIPSRVIK